MADFARISISSNKGYGHPWYVGNVVSGKLRVSDANEELLSLTNNDQLFAALFEIENGQWKALDTAVKVEPTSSDGIYRYGFEPPEYGTYLLEFILRGDHAAQEVLLVEVEDPTAMPPDLRNMPNWWSVFGDEVASGGIDAEPQPPGPEPEPEVECGGEGEEELAGLILAEEDVNLNTFQYDVNLNDFCYSIILRTDTTLADVCSGGELDGEEVLVSLILQGKDINLNTFQYDIDLNTFTYDINLETGSAVET
jgi:hypothetical protein